MQELHRPVLAVIGHILDAEDPETRSLELAQRFFERKVNQRGASEQEIIEALIWLAGTRVQLHNVKGAQHTLGHLRARSRGRFKGLETMASFLEIRLLLEMKDFPKAQSGLERIRVVSEDARTTARLNAIKHQFRGRLLSAMGQTQVAHQEFLKAVAAWQAGGPAGVEDLALSADIYNDQGQAFSREGKAEDGHKAYSQAETVAKHIGFKLAEARSLRGRGIIHHGRKETEQAIKLLRAALDIYQTFDAPFGILKTCISLGRAHYAQADYRQALFYFEEARVQCGKNRYPNEEAEVNARIGDIMLAEGQYEKAAEFYEQDLQIATGQGIDRARAHALRNVGRIQRLLGNFLRAEACLDESATVFHRLGDQSGLCLTLQQMVQSFLEQGKTEPARRNLDRLKDIATRLGRPHELGLADMLEGLVLRHEGRSGEARSQLEKSLRVFSREPGFFTVMCRMELAQALNDLGQRESALHQFKEAIASSRQLKLHDMEKKALDLLAQVDRSEWARVLHGGGMAQASGGKRSNRVFLSLLTLEVRNHSALWGFEPEEATTLMNQIYNALASVVLQEKGVLGKIMGDRIQVVFGLESTCDPGQALRCAYACLESMTRLKKDNPKLASVGVAGTISTGEAFEGMIGPMDRLEFGVMGEPITISSMMLSATAPGEILVCPDTYRAVKHNVSQAAPREIETAATGHKLVSYQVASTKVVGRLEPKSLAEM